MFRLNPAIDVAALAAQFAQDGLVVIDDWLVPDDAAMLHHHLRTRDDWLKIVSSGTTVFELDRATQALMSEDQRRQLDDSVYAGARRGFQFRFETLRVPDGHAERAIDGRALATFAEWMSGEAARAVLRDVTGHADIEFADAQGTAYAPGDFLTAHDDDVAGKNRVAAWVYGLASDWRAEWGGLLLFHNPGKRVSGVVPGFNRLTLFDVPQLHSVSEVSRSAPFRRYSITGWLRTQRPFGADETGQRQQPRNSS